MPGNRASVLDHAAGRATGLMGMSELLGCWLKLWAIPDPDGQLGGGDTSFVTCADNPSIQFSVVIFFKENKSGKVARTLDVCHRMISLTVTKISTPAQIEAFWEVLGK